MKKFLIIQTAFLGDVILTLPLLQALRLAEPESQIDFVAIPATADILRDHPDVSNVILYDKHGKQKSVLSFLRFRSKLRYSNYDVVLCPHRSFRSGLLVKTTRAPVRIGFDNSSLRSVFTEVVPWRFGIHEVERNLSLLQRLGINNIPRLPRLFISEEYRLKAVRFLSEHRVEPPYAVVAPGTVWETKRYPVETMVEVVRRLSEKFANVVVIGGEKDIDLVHDFSLPDEKVVLAIGTLPVMSSAEIIRRSSLLVANDSAPIHIASAFNVPAVAIFGPTVKDFGFFPYHLGDPYGNRSAVVEVNGLGCRPCSIHGGRRCPIVTFDCMRRISPGEVVSEASRISGKN